MFACVKHHDDLHRVRLRGLRGADEQFLLATTARNLKRPKPQTDGPAREPHPRKNYLTERVGKPTNASQLGLPPPHAWPNRANSDFFNSPFTPPRRLHGQKRSLFVLARPTRIDAEASQTRRIGTEGRHCSARTIQRLVGVEQGAGHA